MTSKHFAPPRLRIHQGCPHFEWENIFDLSISPTSTVSVTNCKECGQTLWLPSETPLYGRSCIVQRLAKYAVQCPERFWYLGSRPFQPTTPPPSSDSGNSDTSPSST